MDSKFKKEVCLFNSLHPVGSYISVFSLFKGVVRDEIRFPADIVGHQSKVWLEDLGCVSLERVLKSD